MRCVWAEVVEFTRSKCEVGSPFAIRCRRS